MAVVTTKRAARARANRLALRPTRQLPTSPELNEYAIARLDPLYGETVVENDPYAADCGTFGDAWDDSPPIDCPYRVGKVKPRPCVRQNGHDGAHEAPAIRSDAPRKTARQATPSAPAMAPDTVATDGASTLDPCPKCGRTDWYNAAGRKWHLDNNPACANFRKPEKHTYVAIGG